MRTSREGSAQQSKRARRLLPDQTRPRRTPVQLARAKEVDGDDSHCLHDREYHILLNCARRSNPWHHQSIRMFPDRRNVGSNDIPGRICLWPNVVRPALRSTGKRDRFPHHHVPLLLLQHRLCIIA